jgi:hypothetical protein
MISSSYEKALCSNKCLNKTGSIPFHMKDIVRSEFFSKLGLEKLLLI